MAPAQTGPRLTITGTCEGCAHLITDARDPRLGRGPHAACVHPSRANGGLIFARARGPWPMPSGCPELPAARLALGPLPPTFTARFAEALYLSDDGKGSGALHALLAEVGGTPYDPENDPRYNGTGTVTKKGGKR